MKEIIPKLDLKSKLIQLNKSPTIERIIIVIEILDLDDNVLPETKAIVDTGAIFSLFYSG